MATVPADTRALVDERIPSGLFIGGEWRCDVSTAAAPAIAVVDPGTGAQVGTLVEAGNAEVGAAVDAASSAWHHWRSTEAADRAVLLGRLADLVEQNREFIAAIDSLDNGKPYAAALGHDVPNAVATLRYYAKCAASVQAESVQPVFATRGAPRVVVSRAPLGVVAGLIPWNAPFMMAVWKLAPALAFGNTVVLKPAEDTSLSALYLGTLVQQAGFPAGVVNIVTGRGHTTGAALVRHAGVNKISFTGSTEVGREILVQSAGDFRRVALELGGKSASILFADAARADLKRAVTTAVWAMFVNAGQVCSAGSRLLVERSVYDEVLAALTTAVERIRIGYGMDSSTQLGPLVSEKQRGRVHSFVAAPTAGELVTGGGPLDGDGFFYAPTVFSGVARVDTLWTDEVFGPVLSVSAFDDVDHAVELANDSKYGLAAGLITTDEELAARVASRLNVATVWVNAHNVYDPAVPWGGMKQSGVGREIGNSAVNAYTEEKVLWLAT
jgi:acyl-CoA reductase-like NAD-dependent aldehyde dehydrogenase